MDLTPDPSPKSRGEEKKSYTVDVVRLQRGDLRRESFNFPVVFVEFCVAESVMESVGSSLPKFNF